MPAKLYTVGLSPDERIQLERISQSPHRSLREKTRARILLLTDVNRPKTEGAVKPMASSPKSCASRT